MTGTTDMLILTEVCGQNGVVLADVMNEEIDLRHAETLKIPEARESLEDRMRIMIAGCMLMRVDGISSMWLPWVHDDAKKEITRQLAVKLVLGDQQFSIIIIINHANMV